MLKHESLKPSSSQSEQPLKISAIQFIPFSIQQPLKPIPFASEHSNRSPLQQARHPPFELSAPNVSPQRLTFQNRAPRPSRRSLSWTPRSWDISRSSWSAPVVRAHPYTNSVFTCSAGQSLQLLCLSARLKGAVETKKAQSLVDVQRFENWNGRRIQTFHDAWAKNIRPRAK